MYSITCVQRPLKGSNGSGLLQQVVFNPLPNKPILGTSNSVANNDMMSKIWTTEDSIV